MIDASIYRGIQQPQAPDQMAQYGRMMQIRNMMDQGELAGIQRNKLVKDIASEDAFRQAFDGYDPANHTQTIAALYRADPMRAMQFEKSRLESKKLNGEIDNNAITQQANVLKWFRDRLSAVNDDAGMVQLKADLSNLPGGQMYAASIPQTFDPEWKKSRIMTAEELLLRTRPDRVQVNNGQTIRFVDRNDPVAAAQPVQMLATPGELLTDKRTREEGDKNRAVTREGQQLTDRRQREANTVSAATANLQQQKLNLELQQAQGQKEGAVASFNTALSSLDGLVGNGKTADQEGYSAPHAGMSSAVGAGFPLLRYVPGTATASFDAKLETFKAQTFLPMVEKLKGMGALSNAEGEKLSAAVGALNTKMSEKEFMESAQQIRRDLIAARDRAARTQVQQPSNRIGGVLTQNPDGSFNYGF